jgi:hypothetical protein
LVVKEECIKEKIICTYIYIIYNMAEEKHLDVISMLTVDKDGVCIGESCPSIIKPPKKQPISIFLLGPPATGKSSIKKIIIKNKKLNRYVDLDQDNVSQIYSDKSRDFVRDTTINNLFPEALRRYENIVVDRTGRDVRDTLKMMEQSMAKRYHTVLICVYTDRNIAKRRLIKRNEEGDRVVPVKVFDDIYDDFENRIVWRYFIDKRTILPVNEILLINNTERLNILLHKFNERILVCKKDEKFYKYIVNDLVKGGCEGSGSDTSSRGVTNKKGGFRKNTKKYIGKPKNKKTRKNYKKIIKKIRKEL